ncbi:MAG TPA: serine/threonine-protein kinase [Polyangia bacterium]|jgi:serine/threonine protein kinase/tetratricopeptide (TPR) repeat protein
MGSDIPVGTGDLGRGATIGRYLVLSLIGKGGMGEVYAAYDPELDRKVAIKVLRTSARAGVDAAEGRGRILREAQALAQLSDPNVVAVYDVGTFDDRVFLAMEFVDGSTLSFWQQAQPRTWQQIVSLYGAAGRGLAAAHRRGLVHRDFKPENAMVGRDGQVRVMDFGLARSADGQTPETLSAEDKARVSATMTAAPLRLTSSNRPRIAELERSPGLSASPPERREIVFANALPVDDPNLEFDTRVLAKPGNGANGSDVVTVPDGANVDRTAAASGALNARLTQTGAMMGTPAYMAPEQFAGKIADARSDQFSFCVALYEALYGERPFAGKSLNDLTRNVLAGRVRDAPTTSNIPSWLRKVLLRGLRVARDERHPSMEALLTALARDPPRTRRRWMAASSVAGLIVALTVGLIQASQDQKMKCRGAETKFAGVWELPRPGTPLSARKEAIRRAFMATGKRYAAESFSLTMNALDRYVSSWNDMHRDACEATHVRGEQSGDVLDLRMSCLQDRFNEVRALTTVFSDANGDVVGKAAEAVQSLRPLEQCADVATLKSVLRPPDDPDVRRAVADVRMQLADVKALGDAGKLKQARAQVSSVVEASRKTQYDPLVAEALFRTAELEGAAGNFASAVKDYEDAVWLAEATHHDEVAAEAAAELVYVTGYFEDHYAEAERWSRYAGAILRRMGPGHDLAAGWLANNRALLDEKQGKFAEALVSAQEAVRIKEHALGGNHFDVAISEDNLASVLFQLGRVDEAVKRSEHALSVLSSALGPDHPRLAYLLSDSADLMIAKGRYQEAKSAAERALDIWNRDLEPGNTMLIYALVPLGRSLTELGEARKAIPILERAIVLGTVKDPDHMLLGEARFALAGALWDTGEESERARRMAEQAGGDFETSVAGLKRKRVVDDWISAHHNEQRRVSMR